MPNITLEEWKHKKHAGWELRRVGMLEDGRARIEFVYRMNHHAAFASFDGLEAVTAMAIWEHGKIVADLEKAKGRSGTINRGT